MSTASQDLHVDGDRLWSTLVESSAFGATARGGLCRLALSEEDAQVPRWFVAASKATGCAVTVSGLAYHAGTTPMALRRDPLRGATRLAAAVDAVGRSEPGVSLSTIGVFEAFPGARNTVPETVRMSVDLRHPRTDGLDRMEAGFHAAVRRLRYSAQDIVSGAGHVSVYVSRVAPRGIIFIPCEDGISQNEAENITPTQALAGANVLLHAVLMLDAESR